MAGVEDLVPGVAEAKVGLGIAKWVAIGVAVLVVVVMVGGFLTDPFSFKEKIMASLAGKAATAVAQGSLAAGQADAGTKAAAIQDKASTRDQATISKHSENSNAILAAHGADQPLDPALNDAGRRGLCKYSAYAGDPECAGLLEADPVLLPKAPPGG